MMNILRDGGDMQWIAIRRRNDFHHLPRIIIYMIMKMI